MINKVFIYQQQASRTSISNELETLKMVVLRSLSHHNRAYHSTNHYCKTCRISTPFSPQAFDVMFKPYIHYFLVSKSDSGKMSGSLSPGQFMRCLGDASRSVISADSCTQARIFSIVKITFCEKSMDVYSNTNCPK